MLCLAFTEGTGNDWLGVATIDGYGAGATVGSFAYVTLVASMTAGRWFGPLALDRFGRVPVLRAGALCAMVGVLVVVYGPVLATAFAGIVLWGLGAALGFPTGMSAAADDPERAAARVSVVATIGYAAFLAGPSLIGAIGDHTGVRRALTLTAALLVVGLAAAGATRPPAPPAPPPPTPPPTTPPTIPPPTTPPELRRGKRVHRRELRRDNPRKRGVSRHGMATGRGLTRHGSGRSVGPGGGAGGGEGSGSEAAGGEIVDHAGGFGPHLGEIAQPLQVGQRLGHPVRRRQHVPGGGPGSPSTGW